MIFVRSAEASDRKFFEECLAKDETHKALGLSWGDATDGSLYLVYDQQGPLMFVRLHKALRAAVQFDPDAKYRSARAGSKVKEWLAGKAREIGATEVIVRPGGKAARFTERLGFWPFVGKFFGVGE